MIRTFILLSVFAVLTVGCATISEGSCVEGSWESLGYDAARYGADSTKFDRIAETCAKYGITANAAEYNKGYSEALPLYCTYSRGVSNGEGGSSANQECVRIGAGAYLDGWEEGRDVYEIRQGRQVLLDEYDEIIESIGHSDRKYLEEGTSDTDKARIRRNRREKMQELDEIRIDIRAYELVHDLPKIELDVPVAP